MRSHFGPEEASPHFQRDRDTRARWVVEDDIDVLREAICLGDIVGSVRQSIRDVHKDRGSFSLSRR